MTLQLAAAFFVGEFVGVFVVLLAIYLGHHLSQQTESKGGE